VGLSGHSRAALTIFAAVIAAAAFAVFLRSSPEAPHESVDRQNSGAASPGASESQREVTSNSFVGSHSCGECHSGEWAEWQSNPMYHSTRLISDRISDEDFSEPEFSTVPHVKYTVERRGDAVFHHELMIDDQSRPVFDQAVEVSYVMGSGQQGHAYLISRPGMLFTSPVNWFSKSQQWGLAPGYDPTGHPRFERRVTDSCLSCHTGRVADDPAAKDRLLEPAFHELAIGCERCHGPGQQHVSHHRDSTLADMIVNPGKLDSARCDAVCAQCHLQGVERVLRPGKTDFDFRPGQLTGDVWTIFVDRSSELDGSTRAVSHVEQMQSSVCFIQSNGRMRCTSCHDPHSSQHESHSVTFYRSQCLTCHDNQNCSASVEYRSSEQDSCIACHMPAISASDVPHAAHTNHRILRRPQQKPTTDSEINELTVYQDGLVPLPDSEQQRSRGMALARLLERGTIADSASQAERLLRQARVSHANDADLLECLGSVLALQDRSFEAVAVWKQGLRHDPDNEALLYRLSQLIHDNGGFKEAAEYLARFLKINPWHAGMYGRHAHVMGMPGRFPEGIRSAEKALELDPSLIQVHGWLVEAYRTTGDVEASAKQKEIYDRMLPLTPRPAPQP